MALKNVRAVLTNAVATYYTVPDGKVFQIVAATATNATATASDTFSLYLVDSGGASSDANATAINGDAVANTETEGVGYSTLIGRVLTAGQTIQAESAAGNVITLDISGNET